MSGGSIDEVPAKILEWARAGGWLTPDEADALRSARAASETALAEARRDAEHFREEYVRAYDKGVELAQAAERAEAALREWVAAHDAERRAAKRAARVRAHGGGAAALEPGLTREIATLFGVACAVSDELIAQVRGAVRRERRG